MREILQTLRRRSFVGRDDEIALFRAALGTAGVLFVHGVGGVGKSTLLDMFARTVPDSVRADARYPDMLPVPAAGACPVLLIDTYELLEPVDDWIREQYLPSLPANCLVVIAGRRPPGPGWRADPAWRELTRIIALGNLPAADGHAYLDGQGVPAGARDRLMTISRGHPLTLSMLADAVRRGADPARLDDLPDVVGTLLTQLIDTIPDPRHRTALEVFAQLPVTTADVLRSMAGDDSGELFDWLRAQPFVEESRYGIHPHDVVRDALNADLRWRDPDRFAALYRAKLEAVRDRILATADDRERVHLVVLAVVLNGARSPLAALNSLPPTMRAYPDRLRDGDREPILAMTTRWQGEEQAGLVAYWLDRRPEGFRVFRSAAGSLRGFAARFTVDDLEQSKDPGLNTMIGYVFEHGPPRSGEHVLTWRFFLDRDRGQEPSPSLTLFVACQMLDIITLGPETAWTMVGAFTDATRWTPAMELFDFWPATEFTVGGTRFPVFAHDWRRTGLAEWVDLLHARQLGAPARPAGADLGDPVLSRPEFTAAVRSALRDLNSPDLLRENPLTRSPLVRRATSGDSLRDLVAAAAATLPSDLHLLISRTFLEPAGTQERVAVSLHLSFNTYRRHRDKAVEQITAWLWSR
ncbi:ATP-binding protein [Actinoplanes derwentensis]|uniref:Orc1-like AAA ATPase domain-containing protein n=1 Tax=Actinoplanes derwentensis TaxID=113562 RepID=A0A1H1UC82_9ACTN|nr:ATP-binding protein [Actinoplanes derwentensis]GID85258.1 hypothetical protein Ade03nite_41820 [Actinoplanes derwentensis]SDS69806.1 hypothetical protein SAMN04489716_1390 [Actinoplanes derwentensis]